MSEKKEEVGSKLDAVKIEKFIQDSWKNSVLKTIEEYITIENQSPSFDPDIYTNGLQEKALNLLCNWVLKQNVKGLKLKKFEEKGRTPLIFCEIDPTNKDDKNIILMYGHFDKQPPLTADWDKDLHPYKPIIKNGRLYGRGGADDGYSIFGAVDAVRALQAQNLPHSKILIVIEGSEESGSPDLDYWLSKLRDKIGKPKLVFCLDSGCADYKRLWMTVSLRGLLNVQVTTSLLKEGIHSGGSGLVRDSFHILRILLDKIEDAKTGEFLINEFKTKIPEKHLEYAKKCAKVIGAELWETIPLEKDCQCQLPGNNDNAVDLLLNSTWKPQMAVTGCDGLPNLKGGNVLRKYTTLKLSIRLPPNVNPDKAGNALKETLLKDIPYNAKVNIDIGTGAEGFINNPFENWLEKSMNNASKTYFNNNDCVMMAEGGTIPLMGVLQKQFPKTQLIVTGVLGPNSNAHGPNEFLDIEYTKKVICCVASIIYDATLDK